MGNFYTSGMVVVLAAAGIVTFCNNFRGIWGFGAWHESCNVGGMSFALYLIGFCVMVAGMAWGAHMLHVPGKWIAVGCTILAGLGLLKGVAATRMRDS